MTKFPTHLLAVKLTGGLIAIKVVIILVIILAIIGVVISVRRRHAREKEPD